MNYKIIQRFIALLLATAGVAVLIVNCGDDAESTGTAASLATAPKAVTELAFAQPLNGETTVRWTASSIDTSTLSKDGGVLTAAQIRYSIYYYKSLTGTAMTAAAVKDAVLNAPAPQIINIPPDTQSDTLDATITFPSNGLFYVVVEAINDTDPTKTALSDVLKITVVDAVSSSSKLLTFQINGSSATIYGSNVDITLPAGTVLTALVASFTASSGASVSVNDVAQVSGATPNDFSQPLVYTVTAADSSNSEQYTVTVSLSESLASPPGAVTDLSTTSPTTDTIPLTWSPLTLGPDDKKADGSPLTDSDVLIEVFYSVMNDENITATEIIAQNTTSESSYDNSASTATITNLLPNTPYAIVLKLTNNSDTATPKISSHSNVLRTSTQSAATLPVAMSDLTVGADAHAPTTNAITVTWSPLTLGPDDKKADGTALTDADIIIEVYYSSDPAHDSAEKIAENGSKLTSSLDNTASRVLLPDLSPYTAYTIALKLINSSDTSMFSYSNIVQASTLSAASIPAQVSDLQVATGPDAPGVNAITVTWSPLTLGPDDKKADGTALADADITIEAYYSSDPAHDSAEKIIANGSQFTSSFDNTSAKAAISGLIPNTAYAIALKLINRSDDTKFSLSNMVQASTVASAATAPGAPTGLTLDATTKQQISASWTAPQNTGLANDGVSSATISYTIYYSTTMPADAAALQESATLAQTYIAGLTSTSTIIASMGDTRYYIAVAAVNTSDTSKTAVSGVESVLTPSEETAPGAPTGLTLNTATKDQIAVSWFAPQTLGTKNDGSSLTEAEIAYKLYYTPTDPSGDPQQVKSNAGATNVISVEAGTPTLTATITELTGKAWYYVVVESIHPQHDSLTTLSEVGSAETLSEATAPGAPTGVSLNIATKDQITVSWTAPQDVGLADDGISPATITYIIYYSTTASTDAASLKAQATTDGTHKASQRSPTTISPVREKTVYYVVVEAANTSNPSLATLSSVAHDTTASEATAPGAPTGVSLNVDIKNEITVSWTAPQNTGLANDGKTVGELIYKVYYHPGSYTDPATLKQEAEDDSYVVSVPYSPAVISSVLGATKYSIIVEAIISSDQSKRAVTPGIQSATTASEVSAPGAPTALTLDASAKKKITVHWTAPVDKGLQPNGEDPAVVTYTLYYLASSTKVVATIVADGTAIGDITQLSHTIDNVLGDTVYAVAVESVNSHARTLTALSEAATARTVSQAEAPGAPDNVTLDAATKDEITVSWDEPQEKGLQPNGVDAAAITYKIYYSTTKTTASEIKTEANSAGVSINGNTAVISSVLGLTQYYVIVEAVNAQESALTALSAVASAETASEAAAPGTFLLETPTETSGQIALSWDTPQDPLHSDGSVATITYHVYYSTTATTASEIKAEANSDGVSISGTTATINPTGGIDADLNYYIVVEAVNGGNDLLTTFSNVKILSAFAYNNLALFVEDAAQARIPKWRGSETGTATYRFTDPDSVPWLSIDPNSGEVSIAGNFPVGAVNAEVEAIKGGATYTTIITVLIQYNMDQFLLSYEDEARFITYPNDETRKQLTWSLSQDITMLPASAHSTRIQELYNAALLTITDNVDFSIQRVDGDADMFGMRIDTALGELSIEPTKPATDGIEYRIRATGRGDNFPGTKEGAFMLFVDIALCRPNEVEEETGKYPITTAFQLYRVSDDLSASYTLKNSIDLGADALTCITQEGTTTYSMQTLPLGSSTQSFSGEFEGNGHSIDQLEMIRDQNNDDYVGLFGYVNGASIKNLAISHDGIRGRDYVGVLAGHVEDATIEGITIRYSSATAKIHGRNNVGSLIGKVSGDSTVTNAEAIGPNAISPKDTNYYDILGTDNVGGLIGHVEGGTESFLVKITGHALGTVHGFDKVGGLIGNINGRIQVTGYASGFVKGNAYIGGLVGRMIGTAEVIGYARGSAEGSDEFIGGLVGDMEGGKVRGYVTGELDGDDPDYEIGRVKGTAAGGLVGSTNYNYNVSGYSRHIVELTAGTNDMGFLVRGDGVLEYNTATIANIKGYYSKSEVSKVGGPSLGQQKPKGIHGIPVFVRETTHQENFDLLTFGSELGEWTWVGAGKWPALNMGELKPTDEQPTIRYTAAYDTCSGVDIQGQSTDTAAAIRPPMTNFRYRISRWEHLQWIDNCLDGDFTLENDITLPNPGAPVYSEHRPDLTPGDDPLKDYLSTFDPIGEGNVPFTGSLEGNGFGIRNFNMTDAHFSIQTSFIGLFEQLEHATIMNLEITLSNHGVPFNGFILGNTALIGAGILAGTANNSTLKNIRIYNNRGFLELSGSTKQNVGGIVGHLKGESTLTGFYNKIDTAFNTANVVGLGGLVGTASQEHAPDGYPKIYGYANITSFDSTSGFSTKRKVKNHGGLVGQTEGKVTVAGYVYFTQNRAFKGLEGAGGLVGKIITGEPKIRGYVTSVPINDNDNDPAMTLGNADNSGTMKSGALIGIPSDWLDFQGYYNAGPIKVLHANIPEHLQASCTPLFSLPASAGTIYAYRSPVTEASDDPNCASVPITLSYRGVRLTYPIVKNQFTGFTFGTQIGEWTWMGENDWPAINIGTDFPGAKPNEQPTETVTR